MDQIWWKRVPNSIIFLDDIVDSLLSEQSIIVTSFDEIPWYDSFVGFINESVKELNFSKRFEKVYDEDDPGSYLLKNFCKAEKRAEYRPAKSYAKFLSENEDIVIHERYFWVAIFSDTSLEKWMDFVSEYVKERRKKTKAVFILEWRGDPNIKTKKGIRLFSINEYVSDYDKIVFCTLAASSKKDTSFMKTYLAELVVNVVGNDIELCANCIEHYKEYLEDPYCVIQKILSQETRSNGEEFCFDKTEEEINHQIWRAQIRVIYSILEEYRERFISKYEMEIRNNLPIENSFGEIVDDPSDIELGTLQFMAYNRKISISSEEYKQLSNVKEARNNLSHLKILSLKEIKQLENL